MELKAASCLHSNRAMRTIPRQRFFRGAAVFGE